MSLGGHGRPEQFQAGDKSENFHPNINGNLQAYRGMAGSDYGLIASQTANMVKDGQLTNLQLTDNSAGAGQTKAGDNTASPQSRANTDTPPPAGANPGGDASGTRPSGAGPAGSDTGNPGPRHLNSDAPPLGAGSAGDAGAGAHRPSDGSSPANPAGDSTQPPASPTAPTDGSHPSGSGAPAGSDGGDAYNYSRGNQQFAGGGGGMGGGDQSVSQAGSQMAAQAGAQAGNTMSSMAMNGFNFQPKVPQA